MSRVRLIQIAAPSNPPATKCEIYYDTTGTGTPAATALQAIDESGNKICIGHFSTTDYRLINVRVLTSSTSYVPTAGTRALYVECWGAGGGGGGAGNSGSGAITLGSGGGSGGYSAKFLTGAAVKNPTTYQVGAAGTGATGSGSPGAATDTTWDTSVVVGKAGSGGGTMISGTGVAETAGGAGGVAGTGDITVPGNQGGRGFRYSGTQCMSGAGASGDGGGLVWGRATQGNGDAAGNYGAGGAGGVSINAGGAANGGNGSGGIIRVWEFA